MTICRLICDGTAGCDRHAMKIGLALQTRYIWYEEPMRELHFAYPLAEAEVRCSRRDVRRAHMNSATSSPQLCDVRVRASAKLRAHHGALTAHLATPSSREVHSQTPVALCIHSNTTYSSSHSPPHRYHMSHNRAMSHELWFRTPAPDWFEALPVGNGHLGAKVFGRVADERIALNLDDVWSGDGPRQAGGDGRSRSTGRHPPSCCSRTATGSPRPSGAGHCRDHWSSPSSHSVTC